MIKNKFFLYPILLLFTFFLSSPLTGQEKKGDSKKDDKKKTERKKTEKKKTPYGSRKKPMDPHQHLQKVLQKIVRNLLQGRFQRVRATLDELADALKRVYQLELRGFQDAAKRTYLDIPIKYRRTLPILKQIEKARIQAMETRAKRYLWTMYKYQMLYYSEKGRYGTFEELYKEYKIKGLLFPGYGFSVSVDKKGKTFKIYAVNNFPKQWGSYRSFTIDQTGVIRVYEYKGRRK